MPMFKCTICGYIVHIECKPGSCPYATRGTCKPEKCPRCGAGSEKIMDW
ncbi:MAG: hypothetical protein QXJ68_03390 [Methanocellales archaeon]